MTEPAPVRTLAEALERLDALLPGTDPELHGTLNPPVADDALDALRQAIQPHDLHEDVETLLRWHNGQTGRRWWPLVDSGALLTAENAREHYENMTRLCEPFQWSSSWVPIAHEGWYTLAIECAVPLGGLVIDASFPDPPRPKALSLAVVMSRIGDLADAGVPLEAPRDTAASAAWAKDQNAVLRRAYPHFFN